MKKYVSVIILAVSFTGMYAQETPLTDEFTSAFKKESMSIGALLQVVGDIQTKRTAKGNNGFSIANLRLKMHGKLDGGFSYFIQTSFLKTPAILDGFMSYSPMNDFILDAGLMKVPFSKEYLTSAADIDFVNRSQAVNAMNLGRQTGIQVRGSFGDDLIHFRTGIFNGNASFTGNDNNDFLFAGRMSVLSHDQTGSGSFEAGINLGRSFDHAVTAIVVPFNGIRNIAGADVRWNHNRLLLAGEFVTTEYRFTAGSTNRPEGYHFTAGYMISLNSQLLFRYDSYRSLGLGNDSDLIVAGYNLWPTSVTEVQINVLVPRQTTTLNGSQLLLNTQISL